MSSHGSEPTLPGRTPGKSEPRRLRRLDEDESLRLLGSVSLGRVVFTHNAMPAIRPVNHIVDAGNVIIRTHLGAAVLSRLGEVVAYEADSIDPDTHLGWSVVVTGWAHRVGEPDLAARYERLLRPWVSREMDHVIRIEPQIVTGYALARSSAA
ncbi:pyridoxamine 5'-phosphate oxidase family protein [Pseudonocardia acaciae]|uniref:pyridoxamine 5'-phosphate oxidase family protein n=1 Tax=Pseudonocardia acaciae TaxID=551276 RepID=UPI00048EEDE6|nr:pyridoxamine 5'-phosphate oxidase family protein [Pseudonocardia acaciae]